MADVQILAPGVSAAPLDYLIPGNQEIIIKALNASFNGASAAVSWQPAITVIAPSGKEVGTFPVANAVAAGASVDAAWFPRGGLSTQLSPIIAPRVKLYDFTLLANAASIDTSTDGPFAGTLSTSYDILELWISSRTADAAIGSTLFLNFNGDNGANYFRSTIQNTGTTISSNVGALSGIGVDTHGNSGSANMFGHATFQMFDYAVTDRNKTGFLITSRLDVTSASSSTLIEAYSWVNTAAITRVRVTVTTAANLLAGTRIAIYGTGLSS